MTTTIAKECSICFEEIASSNCCTMKCGHEFCFTCISKYIATTARTDCTRDITCPMCRDMMIEGEEEADYDDSDDEMTLVSSVDSDEWVNEPDEEGNVINIASLFHEPSDEYDEIFDDEDENVANIELVTQKLTEKGFTIVDLASILFNRYKRNDPKYTNRYINQMIENVYEVIDELDKIADNEYGERQLFEAEDVRV